MALSQLGVRVTASTLTWEGLLIAQAKAYTLTENALRKAEDLACWNQNLMYVFINACLKFLT